MAQSGRAKKLKPIIIIDTREKRPLSFPVSRRATLPTGDYSLEGLESIAAVERKSLADLYGCIGQSRERFERELERLASLRFPAIVIESTLSGLLQAPRFSDVHPHACIQSVIAWGTKYRIPVWLCDDRRHAAAMVRSILMHAFKAVRVGE